MNEERRQHEQEAQRRRRLAAAFGDALPEQTGDERPDAWGDNSQAGAEGDDDWLRSQVPPHHG